MRTLTYAEALVAMAHDNVITEARLVDALVRPEEELRNAKAELIEARIRLGVERMVSA